MKKLLLLSIPIFSYSLLAATFYVDINGSQSYSNIQDAINNVPIDGWSEIYVYPGVYHENLVINTNQHLLLSSTNEFSEVVQNNTVIDGNAADSVIKVYGEYGWTVGTTCTVAGVTITNGAAASGGGIYGEHRYSTSPNNFINVRRCNIINCHATSNGYYMGGGAIAFTRGYIVSNRIINNVSAHDGGGVFVANNYVAYNLIANNTAYHYGGGLYSINGDLFHNIISNNYVQTGNGGGMAIVNGNVAYNLITHNYTDMRGGGAYSLRSINIYNNEFSFNVSGDNGGGICNVSYSQANDNLINNLICNNVASNAGGGICYLDDSFALNNTIVGNRSINGGGGVYYSPNTFWINNIIKGNVTDDLSSNIYVEGQAFFYNCCLTDIDNVNASNFSADPQFVDASNQNYRLQSTSPCVNSGLSNMFYSMLPWHDLDGKLRNQAGIDIGCYELGVSPDSDGDLIIDTDEPAMLANSNKWDTNGDGFSDGMSYLRGQIITNTLTNITARVATGFSIQAEMAKMVPGDSLNLSTGIFKQLIIPYFGIKISGTTNAQGQNQTVIDGENKRSALYYYHNTVGVDWGIDSSINHLILTNGNEYLGGAIYSMRSSSDFSINNCDFINNHAINGGAIASTKKYPAMSGQINECKFISNSAEEDGGAIYNMNFSENIMNSLFVENSATNGAVLAKDNSLIDKCVFSNNTAIIYGGVIYQGKNDIRNSLLINNNAQYGGAIASAYYYSLDIQNNTICKNNASQSGGAIYETSKKYDFINNIVWGNSASNEAQIYWTVTTTNFFYNTIQDWNDFQNNNLSNNPDFVNYSADNFHLNTNSYCIDSGTNTPSDIFAWLDLDDSYRVINDYVDRGCYEFYNTNDDIDYNTVIQRLIIVINPPGGGKIIKKVVIYPCVSNKKSRISPVSYPIPENYGDPIKHIATTPNSTLICTFSGMGGVYYQPPNSRIWKDFYGFFSGYPFPTDAFPIDGYPDMMGVTHNGTKDDSSPGIMYGNENLCLTATLPAAYIDSGLGLANGDILASGEDTDTNATSWIIPANAPITMTLPVSYDDEDAYAPAYVDTSSNLAYAPGDNINYDRYKLWHIDDSSGDVDLRNITDDSMILTMTTPLNGGGDYLIGSFPDGFAVAEENTKSLYTYTYSPTTPESGIWCTDIFEYVITKIGYSASKQIVPEPIIALALYLFGALALYKLIRK